MSQTKHPRTPFEELLLEQSEQLMQTGPAQFTTVWQHLAAPALTFFGLDRVTLFPNSMILVNAENTLHHAVDWLNPATINDYIDDNDKHLDYLKKVEQAKEPVLFSEVELASSNDFVLQKLYQEGACLHYIVPLSLHGERWGALASSMFKKTLCNCSQPSTDIEQLKLIGNLWLSHWQHAKVLSSVSENAPSRTTDHHKVLKLSPKQVKVLSLLAQGYSAKQAGKMLNLSPRTVESHKYRLMAQLELHSPMEMVLFAVRNHLI